MSDLRLEDGREITIDLTRLTLLEYRALFQAGQKPEDEDTVLARVCGLTVEDYQGLSYLDWRRLTQAFFERTRNPLMEKNSVSASTCTGDTEGIIPGRS